MSERIEALERLLKLKEAGALNQREFDTQKRSVPEDRDGPRSSDEDGFGLETDERVLLTDDDINTDYALRGRKRFSIYKYIAVTILFGYVAIKFDLPNISEDTLSKALVVITIVLFHFFLGFLYEAVPIIAILTVSLMFSLPFYFFGSFISGTSICIPYQSHKY